MTSEHALERACLALVGLATTWYGLALGWGLFAQVGFGWDEFAAARAIAADNMLTWGIIGPVREYTLARPDTSLYYMHHPLGTWWLIAALRVVLGSHAYVPRLVSLLMSTATPPMLYGIGRRLWGPVPGALTAATYVVLPISLAFGNMVGLEPAVVFATTLTAWGYLRFTGEWRRRWLAVSLLGVLVGANSDWEYYVFLGLFWSAIVLGAYVLRAPFSGEAPRREVARWALPAVVIAVLSVGFHVMFLLHLHALGDLHTAAQIRAQTNGVSLRRVLEARAYWIEASFTSVVILLGKIAVPIVAVRVVRRRSVLESLPLAILAMALIEYLAFEQGADIHIYWSFPFAPYAALAIGVIAASALEWARRLASRQRWAHPERTPWIVLAIGSFGALAILPDGIDALSYARHTGGRFNNRGDVLRDSGDRLAAVEWMAARLAPRTRVLAHTSFDPRWPDLWALQRACRNVSDVPARGGPPEDRYFIADLGFLTLAEQMALARTFHVTLVGRYALVDVEEQATPADAYVIDEREPTALEWYLTNGTQPVRTVRADAWATWELRDAWGQEPNPLPVGDARTPEQLRIAHNIAVARGDTDAAARLLETLHLDMAPARSLRHEARLLGLRRLPGVSPRLSLYFEASRPRVNPFTYGVLRQVVEPKAFTLVRPDDKRKVLSAPFAIHPSVWRAGFVYAETFPLFRGQGRERYLGFEAEHPPNLGETPPTDGSRPLLDLPAE